MDQLHFGACALISHCGLGRLGVSLSRSMLSISYTLFHYLPLAYLGFFRSTSERICTPPGSGAHVRPPLCAVIILGGGNSNVLGRMRPPPSPARSRGFPVDRWGLVIIRLLSRVSALCLPIYNDEDEWLLEKQ